MVLLLKAVCSIKISFFTYKEMLMEEAIPRYLSRSNLSRINLGEGIRALVRVKCGNLGE